VVIVLAALLAQIGLAAQSGHVLTSPPQFRSQAMRLEREALARNVAGLASVCADSVECFEVFRLTSRELRFDAGKFFGLQLPDAREHIGYQIRTETIHPRRLDAFHRHLMLAFCKYVADSLKMPGFVRIGVDRLGEENLVPFAGRGLSGKIASNALWRVDFELRGGKWLATRFVVAES